MDVQTIQKIPQQQKLETIFLVDIQCQKFGDTLYRGKDCLKDCTSLREHAKNVTDFEKKKCLPLIKEGLKSYEDAKVCYICGKRISIKLSKSINHRKVRDYCHYTGKYKGAAHSICNLKFNVPNEIPVISHNGSNCDYHFIFKELVNEFDGPLENLPENTEKYKTFSVSVEKEFTKIDGNKKCCNYFLQNKIY